MVYIYLFCSSLLMFFFSGAASVRRDENEGAVWLILAMLAIIITFLRAANTLSKWLYNKYSVERKKLTITDLIVFDGAMYLLYGILAGLGHQFQDIGTWLIVVFVGGPALLLSAAAVVNRFKKVFVLREQKRIPEKEFIHD